MDCELGPKRSSGVLAAMSRHGDSHDCDTERNQSDHRNSPASRDRSNRITGELERNSPMAQRGQRVRTDDECKRRHPKQHRDLGV